MYTQLPRKPLSLISLLLLILIITPLVKSAPDNTNLVYKGCAKQTFQDPNGVYSSALSAIFGTLIQQSSKAKFFKTTSGSGQSSISGLFQCRGDLSNLDCYNCVSRLPILMDKLCGKTVAARLQLLGCYMLYEVSGFAQISGMEMLYKTCGSTNSGGVGFEERRDSAFTSLENGIGNANGGFYTNVYESVYVLGQCQGDLGSNDCGECIKSAVQRSQVECGSSISGQVYLHRCFVSFSYYPNGVPNPKQSSSSSSSSSDSSPYSSSGSSSSYSSPSYSSSETGSNTGKTVAIILGGAAGVGFIVICLLFAKNLAKKHDGGGDWYSSKEPKIQFLRWVLSLVFFKSMRQIVFFGYIFRNRKYACLVNGVEDGKNVCQWWKR
ncbi:plasmodesmata-located protein 2-like [Rutidosis leptorrhynchoides]|uniref:plasmodesmata-located protein 2-like n=1 Tax=Rutidosis leptorrhynchoides TaxID=125765 RepID=UPI003A98CFE8